jgi:regulation of enolase protein 1 (concanavalin A-like superfamily)
MPDALAYTHPGIPQTATGLAAIKAKVQAAEQPWKSGYDAMVADGHSSLNYTMLGPFATVSRNPDVNLNQWRHDMTAVYNLARMWYFTGNAAYAQKSRDILIAWANTQTSFGGIEAPLDLGDYAFCFAGAADILRGTWSGWTAANTTTVQNFFKNVYWPPLGLDGYVIGPTNKGSLAIVAGAAIAVFNDDGAKMNRVLYHLQNSPSTGFINTLPNGEHGETGRDNGHSANHIHAMAFTAQMLWNQGIDIFSYYDNRLLAMGEYHGSWNVGNATTFVPMGTTDEYYTSSWSTTGFTGDTSVYNILKTAYGVRKGMNLGYLDWLFGTQSQNMNSFMNLLPTDTSTAPTVMTPVSIPSYSPLGTGMSNVDINGASPAGSGTYSNGVWTVKGAGTDLWTHGAQQFHYTYKQISGDFSFIARVTSVQNTHPTAKAGIMIRSDLNPDAAKMVWVAICPSNKVETYYDGWKNIYGGSNWEAQSYGLPQSVWWIKLERRGNMVTTFASRDGMSWATQAVGEYDAFTTAYVGLCVSSLVPGTLCTATFDRVNLTGGTGGATVAPFAPEAVIQRGGINQVQLRWTGSFGATSYSVDRAVQGGGYASIAQVNNGNCSYLDTNVTNGTTYNYKIRAINSAGSSPDSVVVTAFAGASNGTYKIINRYSGKCLDVDGASIADGANIHQWTYVAANNQKWTLTHLGGGQYTITAVHSGKGLDVDGVSTADGANIQQWGYAGNNNQKWKIEAAGGGFYKLIAVHSNKAADLNGPSTANGANVHQWSLGSQTSQQWTLSPP